MQEKLRFLGLDVHAETIAVAAAEPDGEVRSLGTIPNRAESIPQVDKEAMIPKEVCKISVRHNQAMLSAPQTLRSRICLNLCQCQIA
jgi:hypothetical protein